MSYSVFRLQGIKTTTDLKGISKHNKDRVSHTNQEIDLSRSKHNITLIECSNYNQKFNEIVALMKQEHTERMKTMRADRVKTFDQHINSSKNDVACEMVFTSDNEFFNYMTNDDIKIWAEKSLDFVTKDLGIEKKNILHAVVHMDEKTPHLHVIAVPLVKTYNKKQQRDIWSISRRQFISGKVQLSSMQDIYNQRMNEGGYNLERGEKGSEKVHITKSQYTQKLIEENKELRRQNYELRNGYPNDTLRNWDINNKLHKENYKLNDYIKQRNQYIIKLEDKLIDNGLAIRKSKPKSKDKNIGIEM